MLGSTLEPMALIVVVAAVFVADVLSATATCPAVLTFDKGSCVPYNPWVLNTNSAPNGVILVKIQYLPHEKMLCRCNDGYLASGTDSTDYIYNCGSDGKWTEPQLACVSSSGSNSASSASSSNQQPVRLLVSTTEEPVVTKRATTRRPQPRPKPTTTVPPPPSTTTFIRRLVATRQTTTRYPCPVIKRHEDRFWVEEGSMSWTEGQRRCNKNGIGKLAVLRSVEDLNSVSDRLASTDNYNARIRGACNGYWIGGRSYNGGGGYSWWDTTALRWSNWEDQQPDLTGCDLTRLDNAGGCIRMTRGGAWDDVNCYTRLEGAICELDC